MALDRRHSSFPAHETHLFSSRSSRALLGGGVVVAVVAAFGGLGESTTTVTDRPVAGAAGGPVERLAAQLRRADSARSLCPRRAWCGVRDLDGRPETESPFLFGRKASGRARHTGSGIVINGNGTILTNYHVIENAIKVTVSFEKGKAVEAKVVGTDPSNDLAVLRIPDRRPDAASAHAR